MKRNTKKGFTLVELVIVIAVIAILAAVLIPTFGGIIEKANKSAALQEARNEYSAYLVEEAGKGDVNDDLIIVVKNGTYFVTVTDGKLAEEATAVPDGGFTAPSGYANKADVETTSYDESKVYVKQPQA